MFLGKLMTTFKTYGRRSIIATCVVLNLKGFLATSVRSPHGLSRGSNLEIFLINKIHGTGGIRTHDLQRPGLTSCQARLRSLEKIVRSSSFKCTEPFRAFLFFFCKLCLDALVADLQRIRLIIADRDDVKHDIAAQWAGLKSVRATQKRRRPQTTIADNKVAVLFA